MQTWLARSSRPLAVKNNIPPIRLLAITGGDAQPRWLASLADRPGYELVGTLECDSLALAAIPQQVADVVVCEVHDSSHAADWIPQIAAGSAVKLVVLAPEAAIDTLQRALNGVPHRVLSADASEQDLLRAIGDLLDVLSDREREILRLIARGYTNKEIASQLELSIKSVEKYKTRSLEKLDLHSRVEIVEYAIARGWMLS